MKFIAKSICVFLGICCSIVTQAQNITELTNLKRYAKANQEILSSMTKPKVVFMGNSITEMWMQADTTYFTDNNYVCRGIGGQTTAQLLLRFQADVVDLHPTFVIILGGTNDIAGNFSKGYDENYTLGNIKSMAQIAFQNNIVPILCSVLPVKSYPWSPDITDAPAKIISLNKKIKEFAENNNFYYVDYFSELADEENAMKAPLTTDNVHLTLEGYKELERILAQKFPGIF